MHPGSMLMHASRATTEHGEHGATAIATPLEHQNGSDHADCRCLGDCAPQTGAPLVRTIEVGFHVPTPQAREEHPIEDDCLPVAAYLIPFANGPPALTQQIG